MEKIRSHKTSLFKLCLFQSTGVIDSYSLDFHERPDGFAAEHRLGHHAHGFEPGIRLIIVFLYNQPVLFIPLTLVSSANNIDGGKYVARHHRICLHGREAQKN
jgi:hypothetical protein